MAGPVGTPYANGCFFFDFSLQDYPYKPPTVKFLTTGNNTVRFNPNLYADGKVCLSLLGTWHGPGWVPNVSTLLQVLVSIQGLILVEDPWFNEPGRQFWKRTGFVQIESEKYNMNVRFNTLRWAIADPLQKVLDDLGGSATTNNNKSKTTATTTTPLFPYPEFSLVVANHFIQNADILEKQMKDWVKQDPACTSIATTIRTMVAKLVTSQKDDDRKPPAVTVGGG
jgi:ubiquitin-protein ligase